MPEGGVTNHPVAGTRVGRCGEGGIVRRMIGQPAQASYATCRAPARREQEAGCVKSIGRGITLGNLHGFPFAFKRSPAFAALKDTENLVSAQTRLMTIRHLQAAR